MLAIFMLVAFALDAANAKCRPSEFLTEEGHCCPRTKPGSYITKNCTLSLGPTYTPCTNCTGKGLKTLLKCTDFSDALCGCEDGNPMSSTGVCVTESPPTRQLMPQETVITVTVTIALVMIILITVMGVCICRTRKADRFVKIAQLM